MLAPGEARPVAPIEIPIKPFAALKRFEPVLFLGAAQEIEIPIKPFAALKLTAPLTLCRMHLANIEIPIKPFAALKRCWAKALSADHLSVL